jgi:hypothetical protein
MWTLVPAKSLLLRRLGQRPPPLSAKAERAWEISPAMTGQVMPAIHLPGQLERILRVSEFAPSREADVAKMRGGHEISHGATRGFLLRDALIIDGEVHAGGGWEALHPRRSRLPTFRVDEEIEQGALYSTFGGNRYFGQWLIDDCVTYALATEKATPLGIHRTMSPHELAYERLLGMQPRRVHRARVQELYVFQDVGQNASKRRRFRDNVERLCAQFPRVDHPGVFLLRRQSGARRVLRNEDAVAQRLADRRGFRVIDPMASTVPEILAACAGARVVAGVEGSHLVHALLVHAEGRPLLTIQPPQRFCTILKDLTDRDGQPFAFVVGVPDGKDFHIDPDEVERTLDLLPASGGGGLGR